MPTELSEMCANIARDAAGKSQVPFEAGAVVALEEALEPMLEALCKAAFARAKKAGRDNITVEDLKAVSKSFGK